MSSQRLFRKYLINSVPDVIAVARMYTLYTDSDVIISEVRIAGQFNSDVTKGDDCDLLVRGVDGVWKRIEVKGYTKFTFAQLAGVRPEGKGWEDRTMGFPSIIVSNKKAYDAKPPPDIVFVLAECRTKALYFNVEEHAEKMEVMLGKDQASDESKDNYMLAQEYWKVINLVQKKENELCNDSS